MLLRSTNGAIRFAELCQLCLAQTCNFSRNGSETGI